MLTVRDRMTLRLATTPFKYAAARDSRARDELGYSPTRFHQRVAWLIDQPDAEREFPSEVRRLRRLREARNRQRKAS